MLKRACFYVTQDQKNNLIFNLKSKYNFDNHLYFFYKFKLFFLENGYDLSTQDINDPSSSEIIVYCEMPDLLPNVEDVSKSHLLLFESELIRPDNWDLTKHAFFNKIYTWNDDFIDNKKYFKMNFSNLIPQKNSVNTSKKMCTLIAGNKICNHKDELYSERSKCINWFTKYHPSDFDFFGIGWEKYIFQKPYRIFNKIPFMRVLFTKKYKQYKGTVESKSDVLTNYKFTICYENAKNIPGYITEKIFDCFFSNSIPVYWGAPNIEWYVPKDCFLDKRDFSSYDDLYTYMKSMDKQTYKNYLKAINSYIRSNKIFQFSADHVAKELVNNILGINNGF